MSERMYADDWKEIGENFYYSESLELFWYKGMHYDHRSARHNGLIGAGAELKSVIKSVKSRKLEEDYSVYPGSDMYDKF